MEDLKTAAWMLRYGARSLTHNLEFIPADQEEWQARGVSKSPLEVTAEVIRALRMYRPIFDSPDYPETRPPAPVPANLEEARRMLLEVADEYAAALEAAGPELDRPQAMPFGGVFRAYRAVCFPVMDLFHHHGQVCYMQTLLGDRETHWNEAAITEEFAWPSKE